MYEIKRTDKEIDRVLNFAAEGMDEGTHFPGMSYEEGIQAALLWLFGDHDASPDSD